MLTNGGGWALYVGIRMTIYLLINYFNMVQMLGHLKNFSSIEFAHLC